VDHSLVFLVVLFMLYSLCGLSPDVVFLFTVGTRGAFIVWWMVCMPLDSSSCCLSCLLTTN